MSIKGHSIEVSGIPVEIVRKDIKNLHVGVYPPAGRVRVASPMRLSDEAVRLAVVSRLGWVRRQRNKFQDQERQSEREMVSGETHYFGGRRYRLEVVETDRKHGVCRRTNSRIQLCVPPGSSLVTREKLLSEWYRQALREQASVLISKWSARLKVDLRAWGIRKMKTRWGSCNQVAGRIWLNLELAKKSSSCVELIVVHELIHLRHRHHDAEFVGEMTKWLPNWRARRQGLNQAPLGHYEWEY